MKQAKKSDGQKGKDLMDRISYLNNCMARLEELVLQELGWQASWKVDMVGIDFIQAKKIEGDTVEKVVESCSQEITAAGIVKEITYTVGGLGILLTLNMKSCLHIPMEARLKKDGIKPFMCPIANMFLDRIIEVLHYETYYIADLTIDENKEECTVRCAIYENDDKIGLVSDWSQTATQKEE